MRRSDGTDVASAVAKTKANKNKIFIFSKPSANGNREQSRNEK